MRGQSVLWARVSRYVCADTQKILRYITHNLFLTSGTHDNCLKQSIEKVVWGESPGEPMVGNPPSNAADAGSTPGRETKIPQKRMGKSEYLKKSRNIFCHKRLPRNE